MKWRHNYHNRKMAPRGLGDVVERFAQPIAKVIDEVAGTNLQGCGGCASRKERFNALVPDVNHPLKRK